LYDVTCSQRQLYGQ